MSRLSLYLRRLRAAVAAVFAVLVAYWCVRRYVAMQRQITHHEALRSYHSRAGIGVVADRHAEAARDAAQKARQVRREYMAKRDAMRKAGLTKAADILDRLNKTVRESHAQ